MIAPMDIAQRLHRYGLCWTEEFSWSLTGNDKQFGHLMIQAGRRFFRWSLYIFDRQMIEESVQEAIDEYPRLLCRILKGEG